MMAVRRNVNAVSVPERICVHHVLGSAFTTNDAVERINPGGVPVHHGKIMRDQNDSEAVTFLDVFNQFVEALLARGIDARRGFIEQEQLRIGEEAKRNQDALELAAGKLRDGTVEQLLDANFVQTGAEVLVGDTMWPPEPLVGAAKTQREEFADAEDETAVHGDALRDVANARKRAGNLFFAEEANLALVDFLQTEKAAQEGGFTGAVRTDEGDDFTFGNLKADAAEDVVSLDRDMDVAHFGHDRPRAVAIRVALATRGVRFVFVVGGGLHQRNPLTSVSAFRRIPFS